MTPASSASTAWERDERLSTLPKSQRARAARILSDIDLRADNYMHYRGKRLNKRRDLISVPLAGGFRLVFRDLGEELRLVGAMDHPRYDRFLHRC